MLSPVPAAERGTGRRAADHLRRGGHPRNRDRTTQRQLQQVLAVRPGRRRPVAGARTRRRGRWSARRAVRRAARSASRAAAAPARPAPAFDGSARASQRSLVTVKLATGTDPTAAAQAAGPPRSATRSSASGAERVSFHSSAGRTTAPSAVQRDHAVLLPGDGHRRHVVEQTAGTSPAAAPPTTPAGRPRCRPGARLAPRARRAALRRPARRPSPTGWRSPPPRPEPRAHPMHTRSRSLGHLSMIG